ncbi:MAG: 2-oxoglutarate dehydrogenase E1 subunit family protein, partial [Caulobacteraceae bacterium]
MSETSFLYGGNATFVEDLYARYAKDPASVEASWRAYFDSLQEQPQTIAKAAAEPSWSRPGTPTARPDWLSAIDGMWPAVEAKISKTLTDKKAAAPAPAASAAPAAPAFSNQDVRAATLDSVRAIMLIRAFRIRGHLQATLDPLGLEPKMEIA